jgi:hypothetical protein
LNISVVFNKYSLFLKTKVLLWTEFSDIIKLLYFFSSELYNQGQIKNVLLDWLNAVWLGIFLSIHIVTSLWHHGPIMCLLHAPIAWDLKFQVCLKYTFTPATLLHTYDLMH